MNGATPASLTMEEQIARRIDFPTWLPAMLVKELRQGLRQRGFIVALVGFQVVMTLFLIFAVAGGTGSASFDILQGAYWVMINVQLLIVTPLRAVTGLQAELDSRWVDLLMLTRLTAWRIVLGKWFSLVVQGGLLVVGMLPYGVARYFFGSVDLVSEARIIAAIFAASAVLTAAALWSSVLPKIARVALVIAVVFIWQLLPVSLSGLFFSNSRSGGPTAIFGVTGPGVNWWILVFDALLLLTVCLVGAVRKLAPRAESQTALMRLLPLLGLPPMLFLPARDQPAQAALTVIFFLVVAALELARPEEPMECHWRAWARYGILGRLVGRFVQPGWASAIEWVMLGTCGAVVGGFATAMPWKVALCALLAAEALIFPSLVLTWMTSQFTHRVAGYALVLGGASMLGAVSSGVSVFTNLTTVADRVMLIAPISSFWSALRLTTPPSTPVLLTQILLASAVLGGAWLRASPYRRQRRVFETAPTEDLQPL